MAFSICLRLRDSAPLCLCVKNPTTELNGNEIWILCHKDRKGRKGFVNFVFFAAHNTWLSKQECLYTLGLHPQFIERNTRIKLDFRKLNFMKIITLYPAMKERYWWRRLMFSRALATSSEASFCGAFPLRRPTFLTSQKSAPDNHFRDREVWMGATFDKNILRSGNESITNRSYSSIG